MIKISKDLRRKNVKHWIQILALMAVSVTSVTLKYESDSLMTSVAGSLVPAFDGTVMPIQEVPDWVNLANGEGGMTYQEISETKLIPIPEYRLDYLTYPSSSLVWGKGDYNIITNTKITYPVPYAGNYQFDDCGEGCGSHPAVDIKTLEGTPVHAIANGLVTKAGTSSGFGNTIVVEHSAESTVYSSYSHLSKILVPEGTTVTKGQVIGEVGDTGTATTPHLHFQIDSGSAPWHPYWPFTTAEASAAGYGFWDAVDHSVGMENLYKYTINPMDFIADNLDSSVIYTETTVESVEPSEEVVVTTVEDTEVVSNITEEESTAPVVVTMGFESIAMEVPYFTQPGQNPQIKLKLTDSAGEILEDATFDGEIIVSVSNPEVGSLNRSSITKADFDNGVVDLNFYANKDGEITISAEVAGQVYTSSPIYVVSQIEPFAKFGISHDGYFVPGKSETIRIEALDLEGNPTPGFYGKGTATVTLIEGSGVFSKDKFTSKDFPTGVAEFAFTSDKNVSELLFRVTYGTKIAESKTMESRLFNDLDYGDDYYDAISYLYNKGTVQGYSDGTFQSEKTVSRVEALKFIFSGMDENLSSNSTLSFSDTESGQWYSGYLATAYNLGIVEGYSDGTFKPSQGVNRVEFLKMLFNTAGVTLDYQLSRDPYVDVSEDNWYAPYVLYAKENDLFPLEGNYFNPSEPMSRGEVAEVIYRMILLSNN
jgi:hypothetical protein